MNKGELKAIVDDFVQVKETILLEIDVNKRLADPRSAESISEQIAARIVAAKISNGDYKGRDFYNKETN